MNKKFKDVKNVLNMKIVGAALVAGTLFGSTSAFASELDQDQEIRDSYQDKISLGGFNYHNQTDADLGSLLQNINTKKAARKTTFISMGRTNTICKR